VALEKTTLEFEARRRVRDAFLAANVRSPRAAMEVRLVPSAAGTAEDSRKESVA
jgi:hypothetical protein